MVCVSIRCSVFINVFCCCQQDGNGFIEGKELTALIRDIMTRSKEVPYVYIHHRLWAVLWLHTAMSKKDNSYRPIPDEGDDGGRYDFLLEFYSDLGSRWNRCRVASTTTRRPHESRELSSILDATMRLKGLKKIPRINV